MRLPPPKQPRALPGRLFGVFVDPHADGALFYMLLSLLTGTFYFTWAVTGFSLSLGLATTLIGIPLFVLFIASVRGLALLEGRIVETMLGERTPRRPVHAGPPRGWLERIVAMLTDPRTWLTSAYLLMTLPLGTLYFSLAVTLMSVAVCMLAFAVLLWLGIGSLGNWGTLQIEVFGHDLLTSTPGQVFCMLTGAVMIVATLHLARFIGRLAKHLLVASEG